MKTFYFVRHGSTEFNEKGVFQFAETPLSNTGEHQAQELAHRFENIHVEAIISSDMTRAVQTATAIAEKVGTPVEQSALFHEHLRPSVIRGLSYVDAKAQDVIEILRGLWTHPTERHQDEENFHDLKARALQAIEFLERRPESSIVVVSHGTFLKMLLCTMSARESVTPELFRAIDRVFFTSNTGITKAEYETKRWKIVTWNDRAHLGCTGPRVFMEASPN
ncbi:MAG: histidine phosphatase family protein [Candidatus Pacebacteria bacterium]|nr:histidine phosphatase family protein [Candidatus Paceibacterota bacterium]